jgi:hypothetical protein
MKKIIPYIIIAILIGVLISFVKCDKEPKKSDETILISSLTNRIEKLKSEIKHGKIDTLIKIKKVYKTKYDTLLVNIYREAPDTCRYYIAKLDSSCKRNDSINNSIIIEQESQMIKYSEAVGLMQERNDMQEKRHVKDSVEINTLTNKLTRTRKIAVGEALIILTFGIVNGVN